MLRHLSWELVLAWAAVGIVCGIALGDIFTRLVLLVPAGVVAVWLLWNFDVTRDLGAGLIGLSAGPLLLIREGLNPACPVTDDVLVQCPLVPVWPWLGIGAALVLVGARVLVIPGRKSTGGELLQRGTGSSPHVGPETPD